MKTVQPTIKTGRKWKVVEAADQSKERFKMKEVIGQTQNDCKGLGPSVTKLWSEAEGKEKREMVINEIRLNEDSRGVKKAVLKSQQGQWTNWDNGMTSGTFVPLRTSFLIRSVYEFTISCPQTLTWDDRICYAMADRPWSMS